MKLIVGLGNPGRDYANHRHNVGFWVVDAIARQKKMDWETFSKWAVVAWLKLDEEEVWLAKPLTWMNASGLAVQAFLKEKQIVTNDLIVIHDDMDLALGKLRWSFGAGDGGHNGVHSVVESVGTQEFHRLRLGVGRPPAHKDTAEYVLTPFHGGDLEVVETLTNKAAKSVDDFLKHGLEWVQNRYH